MPGKSVGIGPFKGGLNNVSLSGEAEDSEVVVLRNLEVGEDFALTSRPPFQYVASSYIAGASVNNSWKILGIYRFTSTEWYLMCVKPTGATTADLIAVLNGDFAGTIITVKSLTDTTNNVITAFSQIDNVAYFCLAQSATINGFKWVKGGALTDIAAMKKGTTMVAYKNRLWISGLSDSDKSSRVYFSAIGVGGYTPDVWNAEDFLDVAAGEGGFITALLPLNSSLLIFKNDGTWRFSYPSAPKNGQVDKVSGSIGAATATSVVEFENYVYVYDQGRVYELVNSTYTHLNRFVKFSEDPESVDAIAPGVDMSVVNRRILVRYFNTLFAYNVDTRSWSQWHSYTGTPGKFIELPADSASTESSVFIAPTMGVTQNASEDLIDIFDEAYRTHIAANLGTGTVSFFANVMTVTTTSGTTTAYLNNEIGPSNYNIKLTTGQKWRLTGTMTRTGILVARMTYLLKTGLTATEDITLNLDAVDKTFTAPEGAIAANLHIRHTATAQSYTMTGFALVRASVDSPVSVISCKDEYESTPLIVEYIDCKVQTKTYDYKAPSAFKRLFWWGADLKTSMLVNATLMPVALKQGPTWGELEAFTHEYFETNGGTFGNPLSFQETILSVEDSADPSNTLTETGRIFMKFRKAIRFKQSAFALELHSLGNADTGPLKVHSLVTFGLPKEKVTDRVN